MDFTEVILVVLPETLPCCYRAREGSIRATTTKCLGLLTLQQKQLRRDLIEVFKTIASVKE